MVADAVDLVTTREGLILTVEARGTGPKDFENANQKKGAKFGYTRTSLTPRKRCRNAERLGVEDYVSNSECILYP